MSEQRWTPEPWPEDLMLYRFEFMKCDIDILNEYRRARACVNACAGMDDPAKEIAELRAKAAATVNIVADATGQTDCTPAFHVAMTVANLTTERDELRAQRDALVELVRWAYDDHYKKYSGGDSETAAIEHAITKLLATVKK